MTLAEYLALPDVRREEFATEVGLSLPSLSRIANGQQNTTRAVMRRIIAASGGRVTAEGLVGVIDTPATADRDGSETGNAGETSASAAQVAA